MPRQARLDAPGTLHHVIVRGIEKRNIVDNITFELWKCKINTIENDIPVDLSLFTTLIIGTYQGRYFFQFDQAVYRDGRLSRFYQKLSDIKHRENQPDSVEQK